MVVCARAPWGVRDWPRGYRPGWWLPQEAVPSMWGPPVYDWSRVVAFLGDGERGRPTLRTHAFLVGRAGLLPSPSLCHGGLFMVLVLSRLIPPGPYIGPGSCGHPAGCRFGGPRDACMQSAAKRVLWSRMHAKRINKGASRSAFTQSWQRRAVNISLFFLAAT